jgi:NADPH:quinone reductase-like Zn-dependent oxidoreductase
VLRPVSGFLNLAVPNDADKDEVKGQLGASSREIHAELSAFMEKHGLHPPVAKVFEFEDAKEGLKALTTLTTPGKIVVRC